MLATLFRIAAKYDIALNYPRTDLRRFLAGFFPTGLLRRLLPFRIWVFCRLLAVFPFLRKFREFLALRLFLFLAFEVRVVGFLEEAEGRVLRVFFALFSRRPFLTDPFPRFGWTWKKGTNCTVSCTMLQKLSICEVKDRLCWNLIILLPLRFYVKSNFGEFKWSKNVTFVISEVLNFDLSKFEQLSSPKFTKIQSLESLKLPKLISHEIWVAVKLSNFNKVKP